MRHDIKVVLTPAQELARLIRAQRADSGQVRRQRFTDTSGQRVYTMSLDGIPWSGATPWDDPTADAALGE